MSTDRCRALKTLRTAVLSGVLLVAAAAATPAWALPRQSLVPGGVAVLPLDAAGVATTAARPSVLFRDLPQAVVREGGRWVALIGIPLDTPPGLQEATVTRAGQTAALAFTVKAKDYPTQRLTIPDDRMVTPPPEVEARIEAEQARAAELKRTFSTAFDPETKLDLPAVGRLSSRFGLKRVLNGQPRSPHAGLDVAVGVGTPLRAPAPGRVVAVLDLYFTGHTVVVDHGHGLLTLYAHLSRSDVHEGQMLQRGANIGASGVSGRITGPHLHWVVVLGGTAVDPELFLADPAEKSGKAGHRQARTTAKPAKAAQAAPEKAPATKR